MRVADFRREIAWTLVVLLLAGLTVVALWPRESGSQATDGGAGPAPAPEAPVEPGARQDAALADCTPQPGAPPQRLRGVSTTCMADGETVDFGSVVPRPAVINVWATWCEPCREELPALQEYSARPDSPSVLGVQVMSDEADGLAMLSRLGVRFPSVHDADRSVAAALRLPPALPATYVVTGSGELRRTDPHVFRSADEVDEAVRTTLEGAG
ncbi:redoxin domain-containing protein [Allosaccharopolyspora coralli]|uniref:Redoxin domain-containing protein n=1 Tax=Allosaccharopolyspora coralli TaxID=2665642 RepID=A0A5Q3QBB9_9PSEU|nr:redoxin domain-containing protein [Allosaccharopolyspora coralli]